MVLGAPYHREKIPSPSASTESNKGTPKRRAKKVCTRYWVSTRRGWEGVDGHLSRNAQKENLHFSGGAQRGGKSTKGTECVGLSVSLPVGVSGACKDFDVLVHLRVGS